MFAAESRYFRRRTFRRRSKYRRKEPHPYRHVCDPIRARSKKDSPVNVDVCNRLVAQRGATVRVLVDNGNEFSGKLLDLWAYQHKASLDFGHTGKPTDNAYVVQRIIAGRMPESA